jgi:hypothetical protein
LENNKLGWSCQRVTAITPAITATVQARGSQSGHLSDGETSSVGGPGSVWSVAGGSTSRVTAPSMDA